MSTSTERSNDAVQSVNEIQSVDETNDSQEPVDEWIVEIEGRVENLGNSLAARPSIFGNWECWGDFGASFIPETLKWYYVACMTHWFGLNVRSYLKYMQTNIDLAWSYYRGVDVQFRTAENNKRFIEHLLVSSCFLIFRMVSHPRRESKLKDIIKKKMDDQTSFTKGLTREDHENLLAFCNNEPQKCQYYMLTMNYQIPWFVLKAMYTDFSNIGKDLDTPIHKLTFPCFPRYLKDNTPKVDGGTIPEGGFKHLLHIFHWSRSPDGEYKHDKTKKISHFHIPSATELQLSQTVFVNNEDGSIDVSYSHNRRLSGVLKLTPFHVSQYSTKLYEDLLIFERGYIENYRRPFMIYVACMACLVKTEEDVIILREKGVIPITTFDDKDVLRFVQELKNFIPDDLNIPKELAILEEQVMKYHKKSVYRVIGEFKKRYCSNTWIIISVIAGILLFVLTFIQTLYGTLSYYKQ